MKTASLVLGILAFCGMFIAFFPCLGSLNWINIPFSFLALAFSIYVYTRTEILDKTYPKAAIIMSVIAIVIGSLRLVLGGGVL